MGDSRSARLARNQANRKRPLIKVPNFFSWSSDDQRGGLNLVLLERLTKAADKIHVELVHNTWLVGRPRSRSLAMAASGSLPIPMIRPRRNGFLPSLAATRGAL